MLQNIGDKLKSQRWLATLILGLLALIFAVWGAYGIVNVSFGGADYGLKINGESLSTDTLNRAWQERAAQYEQALNGALPDAQKAQLQQQLLEEYVHETLLRQSAQAQGYRATDAQVLAAYQSEASFQLNGKFDPALAKAQLSQLGMTPESYEADKRRTLLISQLAQGLELSDFLTPSELKRIYELENEQREVRYVLLPAQRYAAAASIDDAKIKSWYDAHPNDYLSPESVRLQYAELKLDQIAAQLTLKPEDLQAYYDKNHSHYVENEKRHAHHILIQIAAPKDAKADAAALHTAQQVLTELKAGGDFATLAHKYSNDPGSAAQGGDLGWAEKSAYVSAFADPLFAMQAGQISDPIKTQFGYHIIRLDEIRPTHSKTLAEAHAQIETDYRRDQASEIFGDRQEQLQQKLESGGVSDLNALAKEFGLEVGEIPEFTRSGGGPLGSKPELVRAVFSDDALAGARVQSPVALADDRLVTFKVLEHHRPVAQPLAKVHDAVVAAIRKAEGAKAAKAAADTALKELKGGTPFDTQIKALGVTAAPASYIGRGDPQLPTEVREAAFAVPHPSAAKPVYRSLVLDDGGAALLMVDAVKPGVEGANPKNDEQLVGQYSKRHREGEMAAYMLELERRATIQRNPSIFE